MTRQWADDRLQNPKTRPAWVMVCDQRERDAGAAAPDRRCGMSDLYAASKAVSVPCDACCLGVTANSTDLYPLEWCTKCNGAGTLTQAVTE